MFDRSYQRNEREIHVGERNFSRTCCFGVSKNAHKMLKINFPAEFPKTKVCLLLYCEAVNSYLAETASCITT